MAKKLTNWFLLALVFVAGIILNPSSAFAQGVDPNRADVNLLFAAFRDVAVAAGVDQAKIDELETQTRAMIDRCCPECGAAKPECATRKSRVVRIIKQAGLSPEQMTELIARIDSISGKTADAVDQRLKVRFDTLDEGHKALGQDNKNLLDGQKEILASNKNMVDEVKRNSGTNCDGLRLLMLDANAATDLRIIATNMYKACTTKDVNQDEVAQMAVEASGRRVIMTKSLFIAEDTEDGRSRLSGGAKAGIVIGAGLLVGGLTEVGLYMDGQSPTTQGVVAPLAGVAGGLVTWLLIEAVQ